MLSCPTGLLRPIVEKRNPSRYVKISPIAMNSEGELILIVEDEKGIRESTAEYLRALNYRVLEAANGFEALEMTANDAARPDLVVTDVVMPGMTGPEMAQRLRMRWPDLKIIFMTGYTEEPL